MLALFNKAMRKLHGALRAAAERRAEAGLPRRSEAKKMKAHAVGVDADLREGAAGAAAALAQQQAQMFAGIDMSQFEIKGKDTEWDSALKGRGVPKTGMLSVKRQKEPAEGEGETPKKKKKKATRADD